MTDANELHADELRADIVATRAELAETANALAAKVNHKARVGVRIAAAVAGVAAAAVIIKRLRSRG
jgi:hypothetical protein